MFNLKFRQEYQYNYSTSLKKISVTVSRKRKLVEKQEDFSVDKNQSIYPFSSLVAESTQ